MMKPLNSDPILILTAIFVLFGMNACIQFRQMSLYDGVQQEPPPVKPAAIEQIALSRSV